MKTLSIIPAIIALAFGCAGAPEIVSPDTATIDVVPGNCIQSKLADPSDPYSYQSAIDPLVIHRDWKFIAGLSRGDYMAAEMVYKNPDSTASLSVAMFIVHGGAFVGFMYLSNMSPEIYFFSPETDCYEKIEPNAEQLLSLEKRLHEVLIWKEHKQSE